ncbi:hypothetical protein HY970_02685 [Candidatus Kaiserbacteria bacterium]|nr:hypothetical protein [Candidatus Kaiserbacteria bacterium]
MSDMVRRLAWFLVASSLIAYSVFLIAGGLIRAQASDASRIVMVRDYSEPGVHHLSGMAMVPKTCTDLFVATEQISPTRFALHFTTWEHPSIDCATEDTPRAFEAIVFAGSVGVQFVGDLEGDPLTVVVVPVYQKKN